MTPDRQKLILKLILGTSGVLFAVNTYMNAGITITGERIRLITTVFLILTLIVSIFYFVKRTTKIYRISLLTSSVFLLLNFALTFEVAAFEYHSFQLSQIAKINTCEKAELAFQEDLESEDLRYFLFGMGIDKFGHERLTNVYNLDVYGMGCLVDNSLVCYNELVERHINEELKLDFWAFLEQRE
tara:strand:- start:189 stop:743 length:555 start_codon:yes stop_codon:yes gene_type:complete